MLQAIRKIAVGMLAGLGFLTLILLSSIFFTLFVLDDLRAMRVTAPDKIILTINLDKGFVEGAAGRGIKGLSFKSQTTLQDAVIAIRNAADDPPGCRT